jgi:hypothetical protein
VKEVLNPAASVLADAKQSFYKAAPHLRVPYVRIAFANLDFAIQITAVSTRLNDTC